MKILVTGGLGFIGSSLVEFLLEKKNSSEIHVLNHLLTEKTKRNYDRLRDRVRIHVMDVCDEAGVSALFERERYDTVIHLAARAGVRESSAIPGIYRRNNIEGTLVLLEAVRRHAPAARCVLASSSTVHAEPVTSFYGLTKKVMEQMAELYCRLHGLNIVCLRFFSVYGSDCRNDLLVGRILECIREQRSLEIFGDGSIRRDFTHIEDTLEAIRRTIQTPIQGFHVMDVGTGENHSILDVVEVIRGMRPLEVVHVSRNREDQEVSRARVDDALRVLGFRAGIDLHTGLRKTIEKTPQQMR
ncbi:NAD-dependent epimerase/dehydratase family protein [bacterium]|nr:NAD-dependent epimerase/dehydratase family protein [bacterium]